MVKRRAIALDAAARAALERHRDHDPRPYVRERCGAVLKIAAGQAAHAVARTGLLKPRDPDTIYAWLDWYAARGLAGLLARPHGGYRGRRLRRDPRRRARRAAAPAARPARPAAR